METKEIDEMEVEEIKFAAIAEGNHYQRLVYEGPKPKGKKDAWAVALAKWEFVVRWYDAHGEPLLCGATKTCGLCMLYEVGGYPPFCERCPVRIATGESGCRSTPWGAYSHALDSMDASEMQAAARAELEFLRGVKAAEEGA